MTLRQPSSMRGFTIMEVLVVVMIMGVLLTLAAPSFVTFTASQKMKTASFDLYAALIFARSEAIKRRANVTVAQKSGDWKNGWTVTTPNLDPLTSGTTPTLTLRDQDELKGINSAGVTSVVYRLDGRLTGVTGPVTVLISPQSDPTIGMRCVRVDLTGLPKTTTVTDASQCT
jgi:type IV fimbrial biogenesis protein FimT